VELKMGCGGRVMSDDYDLFGAQDTLHVTLMKRLHITSGLGVSRPVWYASKNGKKTSFQYAAVKSA